MAPLAAKVAAVLYIVTALMAPSWAARPPRQLPGAAEPRTVLAGHQPFWAHDKALVDAAPPGDSMRAFLHFGYSDSESAAAFVESVSEPGSARYGQYLTAAQFADRWGPPPAYVAAVVAWARAQGLYLAYAAANRKYVALDGTVSRFSAALDTTFGLYEVKGTRLRAPRAEPSLPSSLVGPHRLHFIGLDRGWLLDAARPRYQRAEGAGAVAGAQAAAAYHIQPCLWSNSTTYTADPVLGCGYKPQQIRDAYGVPPSLKGANQTVAIVDAYSSPFMQQDLDAWSAIVGLPSTQLSFEYPPFDSALNASAAAANPPPGFDPAWEGEESLDVQVVHGLAPAARIVYVAAPTAYLSDLYAGLNYVVERGLANIVSNSYGSPFYGVLGLTPAQSATAAVLNDIALQAAAVGIGVYFAAGDHGDASTTYYDEAYDDVATPQAQAASPYVTAVGGTTLALGKRDKYVREYGWGEKDCSDSIAGGCFFYWGGGGGVAYTYPTPTYQQRTPGVARVLNATGRSQGRVVPDVAAVADPYTGYIIGFSQPPGAGIIAPGNGFNNGTYEFQLAVYGGTSLACPAMAAMVALKQQAQGGGWAFGFINPLLYFKPYQFRDVTPARAFPIRDIYPVLQVMAVSDTSLQAEKGYDNITGLGTPAPQFFSRLPWLHRRPPAGPPPAVSPSPAPTGPPPAVSPTPSPTGPPPAVSPTPAPTGPTPPVSPTPSPT